MARSFILWLHGLGDSGPANEPIKTFFTSPQFRSTVWSFPSAPRNPVTCNHGMVMPSWFDILEFPTTAASPKDENSLLKAVQSVHAMIDKELAAGTNPKNVFVCGISQGGALTLASVLLYPKTLGGGAILSGWVPFNESMLEQIHPDAKKTPFLWSHGIVDQTVSFETGQEGPRLLEKAGVICKFKAYPGLGHSITAEEMGNLESWIKSRMQKRRDGDAFMASPKDENSLLKAVQSVHAMIDKEVASGTNPKNVFVCGFSQGGALTLASVLLYPKTLGGGAIFSGWVPFNGSMLEQIHPDAKKTPFLWSHGIVDQTVLFEAGQAGPPLLEKAGVTCEFKAYPGLGHSMTAEELGNLESWIKSRMPSSSA